MPEFDEDTYQQKSRNNRDLSYEPGKNADKYPQPGIQKKSQSESSKAASLWVEAAMDAPRKMPKLDKKKTENKNYSGKKSRSGKRNRKWNRRRKPTLWQRILRFFGLSPKKKNRKFDGNRGPNKQGQNKKQGNRRQDGSKPQGRERQRDNKQGKPGDDAPRGEGRNRRRRSRKSNQKQRQNQGVEASASPETESKTDARVPKAERQQGQRSERRERRPERSDRRPEGRERRPRDRDREPRQEREERKPRQSAPSAKMESVAAPKTDTSSLSLGAVDMGESASSKENKSQTSAAPRGKRNRRATARPQNAGSSSEFVPHPIELPSKSEKPADNSEN